MTKMLIKYNRPNVHHIGDAKLIPGVNQVDVEAFESWKALPAFRALFEKKKGSPVPVIEVLNTPKAEKNEEMVDLGKLSVKDANAIVEETLNVELLKKWLEVEKRKGVKETIEAQLELAGPSKPSDGADDDEETK